MRVLKKLQTSFEERIIIRLINNRLQYLFHYIYINYLTLKVRFHCSSQRTNAEFFLKFRVYRI